MVRLVLKELRPNIKNPAQRRVRYIGYVLNLIYKAFLFSHSTPLLEQAINPIIQPEPS